MAIIILPVCFIAIFFVLSLYAGVKAKKREILLGSILIFSALLSGITELLSAFRLLNFTWLFASWSIITFTALLWLFKNRPQLHSFISRNKQKTVFTFRRLSLFKKLLLFIVTGMLIVVFAQGIIYPPNNWDSMTYHLGRIISWVSHQSVAHYPTHIIRQLYQPPYAEYTVMHVGILTGSDYFANSVQFIYLLFAVIAISGITQLLGLNRFYQILSVVLAVTIPEVLLQASSTQNDVVVSFFILSACYFSILAERKNQLICYCFFGLSIGLAMLTKGTAYVCLAPVLLLFAAAILRNVVKTRNYTYIGYSVIACLLCILVNTANYSRNYNLNGSILGVEAEESKMYANERMSPGLLFSSIIKNSSLHLSIKHTGFIAPTVDKAVYKLHEITGINIHDPAVNYHGMPYSAQVMPTSEDSAPNPLHFILLFVSMIVLSTCLIKNRLPWAVLFLLLTVLLQIILFCGYLKWQPWHSRLHVPIFMLAVPVICYAISTKIIYKQLLYAAIPVLLAYAVAVICFNNTRPLKAHAPFTVNISVNNSRYEKYFAQKPQLYNEYAVIKDSVQKPGIHVAGLITSADDWIYPLFNDCFSIRRQPVYLNVNNYSKNLGRPAADVDCIVTTRHNASRIYFRGKYFYNQFPNNKFIYFYK